MSQKTRYVNPFLSIFPPKHPKHRSSLAPLRDVTAVMLLIELLNRMGYQLGSVLFNMGARNAHNEAVTSVDANAGPDDLLLTGTRAPIEEEEQGYRRRMNRGYTTLEEMIIQIWARYLRVSSRGHTMLRDELCHLLPQDKLDRADIYYYMNENARYQLLGRHKVESRSTAAFVLREPALWEGGPGYIGFFGMSSATTLILAHLLRHKHGDLLSQPAFTLLELSGPEIPERPTDTGFANDWKAEVLIHQSL